MSVRGARAVCAAALLALALPLTAWSATVTSAFPLVPLRTGVSTVEVGVEVQGQAEQVLISVTGQSAPEGQPSPRWPTWWWTGIRPGPSPSIRSCRCPSRYPADGVLEVVARPVGDGEGTALTTRFDSRGPGTQRLGRTPLQVRADLEQPDDHPGADLRGQPRSPPRPP